MILRQVTSKDFDWIVENYIDVFSSEPWNDDLEVKQIENYVKELFEMNTFNGFIAEVDNNRIGASLGYIKPWYQGKEYALDTFFISNKFHSKGFGSQFLSLIKKELLKEKIPAIILDTDRGMPAETFYKNNGFKVSEESIIMFCDVSK